MSTAGETNYALAHQEKNVSSIGSDGLKFSLGLIFDLVRFLSLLVPAPPPPTPEVKLGTISGSFLLSIALDTAQNFYECSHYSLTLTFGFNYHFYTELFDIDGFCILIFS